MFKAHNTYRVWIPNRICKCHKTHLKNSYWQYIYLVQFKFFDKLYHLIVINYTYFIVWFQVNPRSIDYAMYVESTPQVFENFYRSIRFSFIRWYCQIKFEVIRCTSRVGSYVELDHLKIFFHFAIQCVFFSFFQLNAFFTENLCDMDVLCIWITYRERIIQLFAVRYAFRFCVWKGCKNQISIEKNEWECEIEKRQHNSYS